MKDFLGNELNVGDKIVTTSRNYNSFVKATVVKINNVMLSIAEQNLTGYDQDRNEGDVSKRHPSQCIKIP